MKLEDACTVFIDGDWIESKDQSNIGIRLIQTGNIGIGEYLEKDNKAKYVSEDTFENLKCTEVFPGDILISRLPEPVGRACIIPYKDERMITAVDCTICRPNEEKVLKEYLCYFMQSTAYYNQLVNSLAGTTRKRISRKNLGKIEIRIPNKSIQTKVITNLDLVTKLIRLKKEELSIYNDLVKSRFIEMFGDPVTNPMGWKTASIRDTSELISDGPFGSNLKSSHYVDDGIRVIRLGNIGAGKFLDDDKAYISEEHYKTLKKYTCHAGEIVIGTLGEPNLRACLIPDDIVVSVNKSDCVHCIPKADILNNIYACAYLNTDGALQLAQGSLHGQTRSRIAMSQVAALPIMLPPITLQNRFADFVQQTDKSKLAVQQSIETLQTLKAKLMQDYFG